MSAIVSRKANAYLLIGPVDNVLVGNRCVRFGQLLQDGERVRAHELPDETERESFIPFDNVLPADASDLEMKGLLGIVNGVITIV